MWETKQKQRLTRPPLHKGRPDWAGLGVPVLRAVIAQPWGPLAVKLVHSIILMGTGIHSHTARGFPRGEAPGLQEAPSSALGPQWAHHPDGCIVTRITGGRRGRGRGRGAILTFGGQERSP